MTTIGVGFKLTKLYMIMVGNMLICHLRNLKNLIDLNPSDSLPFCALRAKPFPPTFSLSTPCNSL